MCNRFTSSTDVKIKQLQNSVVLNAGKSLCWPWIQIAELEGTHQSLSIMTALFQSASFIFERMCQWQQPNISKVQIRNTSLIMCTSEKAISFTACQFLQLRQTCRRMACIRSGYILPEMSIFTQMYQKPFHASLYLECMSEANTVIFTPLNIFENCSY